jgi:hypothetical protein
LHHDNLPFDASFFIVVPHPSYFFLFARLKIKPNGGHFNTIVVIEAESRAVLNTLRKHDFQDAFKNGKSPGTGA